MAGGRGMREGPNFPPCLDFTPIAVDSAAHTFLPLLANLACWLCRLLGFPAELQTFLSSRCTVHGGNCSFATLRAKLKGANMINGTVKFYNATKGFGFITPDTGGKDAFVHVSAIERAGLSTLADGQKVSYDLEKGRDGRESAINIALA